MSGIPSRPSKTRTRDVLEVVAAGVVAVTVGTFLTVQVTESKRKIAMDTIQDNGFRIDKSQSMPSSSKAILVTEKNDPVPHQEGENDSDTPRIAPVDVPDDREDVPDDSESLGDTEGGGGAFNPVTGEINWDCPCLGGMAHGPCGMEFREAFSCFVYSEDEPKGINCVEKFKGMQDCFRRHPEEYAEEIADDDESEGEASDAPSPAIVGQGAEGSVPSVEEPTSGTVQS